MRSSLACTTLLIAAFAGVAPLRAADDPTALARAGTAALDARRFGDALAVFTKAAEKQPGDASLCFGAGVAAFMLGKNEVAQARFECALARDPAFLPAAEWLADLHYRAGRLADAISIYETAQQHSPKPQELQPQLDRWRKELALQSRFRDARSEHFVVLFEATADEPLAADVIRRLETAYRRIVSTLGVSPSQRITAVIYTRGQFDDVTRLADWSAAAYDGRIRVPVNEASREAGELDRILSHEFVHALVAQVGGRTVPAWMNEGLATVLEPAGSDDIEATLMHAGDRRARSRLPGSFVGLSRHDAELAYASSARAVRRLIERRGIDALVALLEDLGQGAPFARAFQQRLAMRYEDFSTSVMRDSF
jgi:tetratricopeptide (TPR) repeat protein